jgi:O-antigen/teichoic acid export membrane protein
LRTPAFSGRFSPRSRIAVKNIPSNLVSVLGGEAAVRAANFTAALFIARVHGGTVLGAYAASLAVITVVVMFADNGLQTLAITDLSAFNAHHASILGPLYLSKLILTVAALLLLAGLAFGARVSPYVLWMGSWISLRTTLQSFSQLQMAVLKALDRVIVIGIAQGVHALVLFLCVGTAFQRGWGIFTLLAWLAVGQLIELSLLSLAVASSKIRCTWPAHAFFWASMRRSTPFGITSGLANLIVRSDTIVLSALVPLAELGNFSAANSILAMVYVTAWLLGSVLLPPMVRQSGSLDELKTYVRNCIRWTFATSIPCVLAAFWAAPKVLVFLYGSSFARAGALASVMALACPFILANAVYTNRFLATNSRTQFLGLFAWTAIAAFVLDLFFGGMFGAMGVAIAIVIREVGMLLAFWVLTSRIPSPATQLSNPASS